MPTLSESLAIAAQHHQAGQLQIAEQIYRQILAVDPDHVDALHLLGVIAAQVGRHDLAEAYIRRAVELNGAESAFHSNLGNALQAQGKFDEAITSFRRALQLKPHDPGTLYNLGIVLRDQKKLDEAADCFRQALVLAPEFAEAHNNLGSVFQAQGKLDDAVTCFRRALELKPDVAEPHNNLGTILQEQDRVDEAIVCFRHALELKPHYAEAWSNLGNALKKKGQLDEAARCCRRAIELKPDYAEAHSNLGGALYDQGHIDEAIACFHRALQLKPDYVEAQSNLGIALQAIGNLDEAIDCFCKAMELKPGFVTAQINLGHALLTAGNLAEAVACFRQALQLDPSCVQAYSNLLYTLHFSSDQDAQSIYDEHCQWNRQQAESLAERARPHCNHPNPDRRLRVAYVSPNFRRHAESFFLAPLFSAHNHEQFQIFCYSDVVRPDEVTAKLRSYSDVWQETFGISDERLATQIRNDQIDILVDLTMHMAGGRPLLFARRPAPVQVCWLAYQGTTGLKTMDYRLTDPHLDPPGMFDRYYSEESFRLPDSFWCYDPLTDEPSVNALPAPNTGHVTFGCLNNFSKVTDDVLRLWANIMRTVDCSRLLLLAGKGLPRQRTTDFLRGEGIAPERITFQSFVPRLDYLRLYHHVDVGLDTFPYNGQTTTLDAVWMGIPVVTIVGKTSAARAGASLLCNLGAPELVAATPDQFVSIAVGLAQDWKRLSVYRATLRERLQTSLLMDAPRFAGNVEAAYRTMWRRWCAK